MSWSHKATGVTELALPSAAAGSGPQTLAVSYSAAIFSQFSDLLLPSTDLQVVRPVLLRAHFSQLSEPHTKVNDVKLGPNFLNEQRKL